MYIFTRCTYQNIVQCALALFEIVHVPMQCGNCTVTLCAVISACVQYCSDKLSTFWTFEQFELYCKQCVNQLLVHKWIIWNDVDQCGSTGSYLLLRSLILPAFYHFSKVRTCYNNISWGSKCDHVFVASGCAMWSRWHCCSIVWPSSHADLRNIVNMLTFLQYNII